MDQYQAFLWGVRVLSVQWSSRRNWLSRPLSVLFYAQFGDVNCLCLFDGWPKEGSVLDRRSASLLILLDLSAVLDTSIYGILLKHLLDFGLSPLLHWLLSCLLGRAQRVVLGDS